MALIAANMHLSLVGRTPDSPSASLMLSSDKTGRRLPAQLQFGAFRSDEFEARANELNSSMVTPQDLKVFTFAKAAKHWLEYKSFTSPSGRARFVSPRSLVDLNQYVGTLNKVFERKLLASINAGHIRQYQLDRAAGKLSEKGKEVGPNKINQEVGTLIRILKYANLWSSELEEIYMPLQREESDIPKALSPSEQNHWLTVARSNPKWHFVYWYSLLGFDCPLSTNEARGLRLGDLDLDNNLVMVRVRNSKNKYRTRSIPMSDTARWAVDRLIERAREAAAVSPQHYLMPFRLSHTWHPDRPMTVSGIKKPWDAVRKAANLGWFTPYGLRHTSITRYAEAGTPMAVLMSLAGHMSRKMQDHYTHISEQAKRKAVQNVTLKSAAQHRHELSL
jgi:integrase